MASIPTRFSLSSVPKISTLMKRAIFLLVFLGVAACTPDEEKADVATIYYIPLGTHTFSPVTEENIERGHDRFGTPSVSSSSFFDLLEIFNAAGPGELDGHVIRAKIILPAGDVIFVDNLGGVRMPGRPDGQLSEWSYDKVGRLLHDMTAEVEQLDRLRRELSCADDMAHYEKIRDYVIRTQQWSLEEFCISPSSHVQEQLEAQPYTHTLPGNDQIVGKHMQDDQVEYVVHYFGDFINRPPGLLGGGESFSVHLNTESGDVLRVLYFQ